MSRVIATRVASSSFAVAETTPRLRNSAGAMTPARRLIVLLLSKDVEERAVNVARIRECPFWDGVDWADKEHQVNYTYWGMRSVFQRLNLTKTVPRPKSPKASAEDQDAWKKGG